VTQFLRTLIAVIIIFASAPSFAISDQHLLWLKYQEIRDYLKKSDIPIHVQSGAHKGVLNAEVYGELDYPIKDLAGILAIPANWCQFTVLHPNVKACTGGQNLLTLHVGRKLLKSVDDADVMKFRFRTLYLDNEYFKSSLEGDKGPMGIRNYRFEVEAMNVGGKTFVRIQFSYKSKLYTKLLTSAYVATHRRIGFSVIGINKIGQLIYSKGKKALIERNVMRCYLALIAFMDTKHMNTEDRFEVRTTYWFNLMERYFPKPYDVDRKKYIITKSHDLEEYQPSFVTHIQTISLDKTMQ